MTSSDVLDLVYQALRQFPNPDIIAVSFDGDHKSSEIILTTKDGSEKTDWVIRSKDVTPSARDRGEGDEPV